MIPTIPPIPTSSELEQAKLSIADATSSIITDAASLIITDQSSYTSADEQLKLIRSVAKIVDEKLGPIIRPIYDGLQDLYALKRELSLPLESAELSLKSKMAQFQLELRKKEQEQQRLRDEETRRLSQQAQEELAKTQDTQLSPVERARAKVKAQQAVTKSQELIKTTTVLPVRAKSSSVVVGEKWEVADLKLFLQGVIDGTIPEEMVTVHAVNMGAMWKMNKGKVKGWPGVKAVEGVRIAGR